MAIDLTFGGSGGGGGGGSSSDYVKDVFEDTSVKATNNTDLTSTTLTNPTSQLFGDDDAPKYSTKTLYVKSIELIEDRSKWISNKPTYKINWNETFPGVFGYVVGNPRKISYANNLGTNILLHDVNDLIGITGNIVNLMWLVNPCVSVTATAKRLTDSVAGTNIDYSSQSASGAGQGFNKFAAFLHGANQSDDLHDYQLQANEIDTLSFVGVVVYFENSTNDIKIFPGNTYIDKIKVSTIGMTSMALPLVENTTGSNAIVYKIANGTYGITTQNTTPLITGAVGSSGSNSLTLTTGTGASFSAGMGFVAQQGTSFIVGSVLSISTDTITAGENIPFALAGATLWRAWNASSTATISSSLYCKKFAVDPIYSSNPVEAQSFGALSLGNYIFSEPTGAFRAWGSLQQTTSYNGIPVLKPAGATAGFLQVSGDFQAADIEWIALGATATLHGTFSINGVGGYGQNQGFSGIQKQTIFTDAQNGLNSIVFSPGASFSNMGISKINLYQLASPSEPTLGRLAEVSSRADTIPRATYNATLTALGLNRRHYADEFFLQGAWSRAATTTAAGGVCFIGSSSSSIFKFQYYGKDFAMIGTAGTSSILTVDGTSSAIAFNSIKSVSTLGFHTIQFLCQSGTHLIEAIDIFKPKKDIVNLQNFSPLATLADISKVYVQSDTPQNAKDGDLWSEIPLTISNTPRVWLRSLGYWLRLSYDLIADDPHFDKLFVFGGVDNVTITSVSQTFNETSWSLTTSIPLPRRHAGSGSGQFQGKGYVACGDNSVVNVGTAYAFNKISWNAEATRSVLRSVVSNVEANGFYYINKGIGTINDITTGSVDCGKYNGTAWAEATAWSIIRSYDGSFSLSNLVSALGGFTTASAATNTHETRSSVDSISTATVIPAAYGGLVACNINQGIGLVARGQGGSPNATSYQWNGSSWSASFSSLYGATNSGAANSYSKQAAYINGGTNSGPTNDSVQYNGISFRTTSVMSVAVLSHVAASF